MDTERTRENLAWAAGIFEGEGSFQLTRSALGTPRVRAGLGMSDFDVVERFVAIIGASRTTQREDRRKPDYKDILRWQSGTFEEFQAVAAMLWPWLGERRRARARECLAAMKNARAAREAARMFCNRGHLQDDANVYVWSRGRKRYCKTCLRINGRKTDAKRGHERGVPHLAQP